MEAIERIKCPKCGAEIDVNAALFHEFEGKMEANYTDRLKTEREKIRQEVSKESEGALKTLQESLKEKSAQVSELNKTKAEIARLELEKNELQDKINAEKDAELAVKLKAQKEEQKAFLKTEQERIKKEADEENQQKMAELQKQLDDQKALATEMKRKAEQGSMQLQGEVQELAIENILKDTFRYDEILEVPKGVKGADVIQKVKNNLGAEVGIIVYESKRTKNFGKDWISKLKSDGDLVKADICVLITEVLPEGIERVGQIDGVWVCTFNEFKGVALLLRDSLVKISMANDTQTNKGEKMQMLYDYLTGKEFSAQFRVIIEGFGDLQKGYLDERNRMEKIWKKREKQLEQILLNANYFVGSIKGIAGASLPEFSAISNDTLFLEED
ncbi:MAG: DUF2130 domain-containing protein [Termitinemataceae bacterium]|nr:MAG: DUF2130 domain-containing protein [Termitinemataceae bacterium]